MVHIRQLIRMAKVNVLHQSVNEIVNLHIRQEWSLWCGMVREGRGCGIWSEFELFGGWW